MEHPDITSAIRTGYPMGHSVENADTRETRRDFVADDETHFISWALREYPDILGEYIEAHKREYLDFLN